MIEALCEVVEGWTDALPFTLEADGTPIDLTGLTVTLYLKDNRGTFIHSGTSAVTVLGAAGTSGAVSYTPQSTGELLSKRTPYKIRFKISTANSSQIVYFPNIDEDILKVNVV